MDAHGFDRTFVISRIYVAYVLRSCNGDFM